MVIVKYGEISTFITDCGIITYCKESLRMQKPPLSERDGFSVLVK